MFAETELKGQLRKVYFKIKDTIHTLGWHRGRIVNWAKCLKVKVLTHRFNHLLPLCLLKDC